MAILIVRAINNDSCVLGMKGVIAECHFDGSRNAIASLGGLRRWILASPDQCESLYLLPKEHPSGRHSEIDWSKPKYKNFPLFANAQANEVIMRPGEVKNHCPHSPLYTQHADLITTSAHRFFTYPPIGFITLFL